MKIGNVILKNNIFLAPMAGVTDLAFRILCRENNCGLAYSEMTSINGIFYDSQNTFKLLETNEFDRPLAVQLFGHEPKIFYDAIKKIDSDKFDIIDINMGCPAKKIIKNGDGAFLLENPNLIYEIIKSCVAATNKPITVKIRKGFIENKTCDIINIAKIIEQAGASAICIHGRTAKQAYSGNADWQIISDIKKNISIPVIGNGDIKNHIDAKKMFDQTNCDAIMIGRAAFGNPWIFKQIKLFLDNNQMDYFPTAQEKILMAKKHLDLLFKSQKNILEIRRPLFCYIKNFYNASHIRCEINKCESYQDFNSLLDFLFDSIKNIT